MTQRKAISLISGGLDSMLATKAILEQGIHENIVIKLSRKTLRATKYLNSSMVRLERKIVPSMSKIASDFINYRLIGIKYFFGVVSISIKSSAASMSFDEELLPKAMTSTRTPKFFRYSSSGT